MDSKSALELTTGLTATATQSSTQHLPKCPLTTPEPGE